jgi:hypothetical protein
MFNLGGRVDASPAKLQAERLKPAEGAYDLGETAEAIREQERNRTHTNLLDASGCVTMTIVNDVSIREGIHDRA